MKRAIATPQEKKAEIDFQETKLPIRGRKGAPRHVGEISSEAVVDSTKSDPSFLPKTHYKESQGTQAPGNVKLAGGGASTGTIGEGPGSNELYHQGGKKKW